MHRLLRHHLACLRYLQERAVVRRADQYRTAEMRFCMRSVLPAAFLLAALQQAPAQQQYEGDDVRDLKIGGKVADLPAEGYVDFSCAAEANAKPSTDNKPAGWSAWRDCPAGS